MLFPHILSCFGSSNVLLEVVYSLIGIIIRNRFFDSHIKNKKIQFNDLLFSVLGMQCILQKKSLNQGINIYWKNDIISGLRNNVFHVHCLLV